MSKFIEPSNEEIKLEKLYQDIKNMTKWLKFLVENPTSQK